MNSNYKGGTCATCAFFSGKECRKELPQIVVLPENKFKFITSWPKVDEDDWCGRYEVSK